MIPAEEHVERYIRWVEEFAPVFRSNRPGVWDNRLVQRVRALSDEQLFEAIGSAIPGFTTERFIPNLGSHFHYAMELMHGECIRRGISNPWQNEITATTESGRGANQLST